MAIAARMTAWIGFGEAARTFAAGHPRAADFHAFDVKTGATETRAAFLAAFGSAGVQGQDSLEQALQGASVALSLVTADSALEAARAASRHLQPGCVFLDGNSVSPATKQAAADLIEAAGGRFVDMAIMAPVSPLGRAVPVLLSGAHAMAGQALLEGLGFTSTMVVGPAVGQASSIKMIRSVMIKGIEALSAECGRAAQAAGVFDTVMASLDASEAAIPWADRYAYNSERMQRHGLRRAAEMEQVVATLAALGVDSRMSEATLLCQRAAGTAGA